MNDTPRTLPARVLYTSRPLSRIRVMGKPGEEKIDDVRRRLLRRGVYVAPVVLAVIAVRNAGAQGVSGPAMGNMGNSGMDKAGLFG